MLEANRKQILATNNQDTKTRLRTERYQIQDAIARLREFIDDPINHEGGDFMVRLGAEEFEAEGEDITLKDSAKLGFGLGAGLLGFRVALFGASALVGGFILNRNN